MSDKLLNLINAERQKILTNWQRWDVPPVVAIENTSVLGPTYGGYEGRATHWIPLGKVSATAAMVQVVGDLKSLWVDPKSSSYVEYYRTFLADLFDVDATDLTKNFDIDHMYNRERAINFGYSYVRMFPIVKSANRSHGAGYEKAMTESDIGRRRKIMKLLDEVSTMKFFGVPSPRKSAALTGVQQTHADNMAKMFDLSKEQIEEGISSLMARANR